MFMFLGLLGLIAFIVFIIMAIISLRKKNGKAVRYFIIAGVSFILIIVGAVNVNSTNVAEEKKQEQEAENEKQAEINAKEKEKADAEKEKKAKEDAEKKEKTEKKEKEDTEKKEKEAKEDADKKEKEKEKTKKVKTDKKTKKDTKKKKKKEKNDGGEKYEVDFEDYKVILEVNDIEVQTKEDNKVIALPYTWENLTEEKLTFLTVGGIVVKQNREELHEYSRDSWTDPDSDIFKENASGDKKTISPTYQLINETDPIEITFYSFSEHAEEPKTINVNINK